MKKIFILLLLAANICFAQAIIQNDPTEPYGQPRPDYWIGRHDRNPHRKGEVNGKEAQPRKETKHFNVALSDSYTFGTNVRVNDNPAGTSFESPYSSGSHAIAARGDTVYLVWRSDRNTNSTIYFDKSTDGGNTWGTDVRISDSDSGAIMPALAVGKDGTIYVSWTDFRDASGYRHIYFAKSTDGGTSFLPSVRVSAESGEMPQQFSSIAVNDSGNIFIAYEDWRNYTTTAMDIYCSRSTNSGSSFEPAVRVDDCIDSINQWFPCVASTDSSVFVVWEDFRDTSLAGQRNIYLALSNNNGINFNNNMLVNDTIGISGYSVTNPSIAIYDSLIYLVWQDTRNGGQNDIYFTKSTDSGKSFISPNINLIDAAGSSFFQGYPSLCCDDSGGVYCAWEDRRNGLAYPWLIYFSYSKNYGDTFATNNIHVDDRTLTEDVRLWNVTICANNKGKVFGAWSDDRNGGDYDIYTTAGIFTGIEGEPPTVALPGKTNIMVWPTPFSQRTSIKYTVKDEGSVKLAVYNICGQLVKIIDDGFKYVGEYNASWDGRNSNGFKCNGGIYFIHLSVGKKYHNKKIIYIK